MPRKAREKSSSGIYHVMLRGINRQNIFEDDRDRQKFIDTISFYKTISHYKLYGYCLMNNHIHLLIKETEEPISKVIKRISSSYVHWYNKKYDRCGHLFQERFKSEVVETDKYFLTALRYIHQNPIKAGITDDMKKYWWSSYREYIGTSFNVDVDFALDIFGQEEGKTKKHFINFMEEKNDDKCLEYIEKINITDDEVLNNFKKLGFANISEIQHLEKEKRDKVIKSMKSIEGITIRQLERITGIPKSIIHRI